LSHSRALLVEKLPAGDGLCPKHCALFWKASAVLPTDHPEEASLAHENHHLDHLSRRVGMVLSHAPDTARTCNLQFRRLSLYPVELRVLFAEPLTIGYNLVLARGKWRHRLALVIYGTGPQIAQITRIQANGRLLASNTATNGKIIRVICGSPQFLKSVAGLGRAVSLQ
jgi:hypothetical protein